MCKFLLFLSLTLPALAFADVEYMYFPEPVQNLKMDKGGEDAWLKRERNLMSYKASKKSLDKIAMKVDQAVRKLCVNKAISFTMSVSGNASTDVYIFSTTMNGGLAVTVNCANLETAEK